ncbi:hypothetical protein V1478_014036 [Vespula squamosa]|uniref:Uncharacterized protein n=1 Tax=Vespula squamosa TaxID=30214 RepID=A0ABD2A9G8_VESSQ
MHVHLQIPCIDFVIPCHNSLTNYSDVLLYKSNGKIRSSEIQEFALSPKCLQQTKNGLIIRHHVMKSKCCGN